MHIHVQCMHTYRYMCICYGSLSFLQHYFHTHHAAVAVAVAVVAVLEVVACSSVPQVLRELLSQRER